LVNLFAILREQEERIVAKRSAPHYERQVIAIYGEGKAVALVAMLHNANRKRATCTASGDGEERRREEDGYYITLQ
jgi:hypothetical protein